jgi:type IV secretion system protein VirD4
MNIKTRFILFFILLFTVTPALYLFAIKLIFQIDPLQLQLWQHIEAIESIINKTAHKAFSGATIVAIIFPFIAFIPKRGVKGEHGSASWATTALIKKMKLFEKKGIVLAKYGRKELKYSEKLSVLVLAPPATGKSAGVSIPNLLTFEDSAFVLDV